MTHQSRFWLLALVVVSGLVVAFWSASIKEPDSPPSDGVVEEIDSAGETMAADAVDDFAATQPVGDHSLSGAMLNQQAINAWHRGEIEQAMALFEQAIAAAPDDPVVHSNYGRLLTLMASYEQALPLLERARELTPGDAQAWLDLATLYERAQLLDRSWEARAEATRLIGADAITRDEQGRFVVQGSSLWQ